MKKTDDIWDFTNDQKSEMATMVLSKIKAKAYQSMMSSLGLRIKGGIWKNKPVLDDDGLPDFNWPRNLKEDCTENRVLYMKHLSDNFEWPTGHVLVDCNNEYKTLLNTKNFDGKHSSSGNIDVVVVEQVDADNFALKQNIKAGIEIKLTSNNKDNEKQVVVQHISASSLNPDFGVLTLMTDLCQRWHFYYFAANGHQRQLYKVCTTKYEAAFLLQHMFDQITDEPQLPVDFLNRGTWNQFLANSLDLIAENTDDDIEDDGLQYGSGGGGDDGNGSSSNGNGSNSSDQQQEDTSSIAIPSMMQSRNHYSSEEENMLDQLQFASEDERREIIVGYLADNVVPGIVCSL